MSEPQPVLFFGCHGCFGSRPQAGHFLWRKPGPRSSLTDLEQTPWGYALDSKLAPAGPQIEGRALCHHADGWTALAWWDRSVDSRPGSNAAVLVHEDIPAAELLRRLYGIA